MMYQNELCHHGRKGQKWGQRNGPPYPLNKEGQRKVFKQLVDKYIKEGSAYASNLDHYEVGDLTTMIRPSGERFVSGLIHGHDFDWQEVTNYTFDDEETGETKTEELNPADLFVSQPNFASAIYGSSDTVGESGHITDGVLEGINPEFGASGTTQNCAKCAATIELAQNHGVVFQAGRQTYPSSCDAASWWFKDATRLDYDYDDAQSKLESYGPGASGTVGFQYPDDAGGHAVHWSIGKEGDFEIQDGQNGRRFGSLKDMMDTYGGDTNQRISTFRLDTAEPDWEHLADDSVVRHTDSWDKPYNGVRNKWSGRRVDTW